MSEFKFACPVCGQHITVASSSSGEQMDCPTCYRKIVIPQAPAGNDSKLLLSAAQPAQPRPTTAVPDLGPLRRPHSLSPVVATVLLVGGICVLAGVLYSFRSQLGKLIKGNRPAAQVVTNQTATNASVALPAWTLDPTKAVIPEQAVCGRLHGTDFTCQQTLFAGGVLSFRKGPGWPPELGLDIFLSARGAEQLNGKHIIITPGARSVVSKVVLRWKDSENRAHQQEVTSGYALMLSFGQPTAQRLPGRVHAALPDVEKSFLAGTFEAEIVQPRTTSTK